MIFRNLSHLKNLLSHEIEMLDCKIFTNRHFCSLRYPSLNFKYSKCCTLHSRHCQTSLHVCLSLLSLSRFSPKCVLLTVKSLHCWQDLASEARIGESGVRRCCAAHVQQLQYIHKNLHISEQKRKTVSCKDMSNINEWSLYLLLYIFSIESPEFL